MQNEECRMKKQEQQLRQIFFFILHSAFFISF